MSMEEILIFTEQEKRSLLELTKTLERNLEKDFLNKSYGFIKEKNAQAIKEGKISRDSLGFNPIVTDLKTACLVGGEIGFQSEIMASIMLNRCVEAGITSIEEVENEFGESVT